MKRFHPMAVGINPATGERTTYLLTARPDGQVVPKGGKATTPLRILTALEFVHAVANDEVQFFVNKGTTDNPIAAVEYSEEELRSLEKTSRRVGKSARQHLSEQEYWSGEVTFYDSLLRVPGTLSVCLACCRTMSLTKLTMLQGIIYGMDVNESVWDDLKRNALYGAQAAEGMWMYNWELSQFMNVLHTYSHIMSVNVSIMQNTDSVLYDMKMIGFSTASLTVIDSVAAQVLNICPPPMVGFDDGGYGGLSQMNLK